MPVPPHLCLIDGCKRSIRKDAIIAHIKKHHGKWLYENTLGKKQIAVLNRCIQGEAESFYCNDDWDGTIGKQTWICFATGAYYTKESADEAVLANQEEHTSKWLELFTENMDIHNIIERLASKATVAAAAGAGASTITLDMKNEEIASLQRDITVLKYQVGESRTKSLETDLATTRTDMAVLAGRNMELQHEIDDLQRQLTGLRSRMSGGVEAADAAAEAAILARSRYEKAESGVRTKVSDLQHKLAEYKKENKALKLHNKELSSAAGVIDKANMKHAQAMMSSSGAPNMMQIMAMAMAMGAAGGAGAGAGASRKGSVKSASSVSSYLPTDSDSD